MNRKLFPLAILALTSSAQAGIECRVGDSWYHYPSPPCADGKAVEFRQAEVPKLQARPVKTKPAETESGWDQVKSEAISRCEKRHESHSVQAGCLRNEENGYRDMQGDYDLPPDVAAKAKARCIARHESWSLRSGCMRNESKGYKALR